MLSSPRRRRHPPAGRLRHTRRPAHPVFDRRRAMGVRGLGGRLRTSRRRRGGRGGRPWGTRRCRSEADTSTRPGDSTLALEMIGISKRFPGVVALDAVEGLVHRWYIGAVARGVRAGRCLDDLCGRRLAVVRAVVSGDLDGVLQPLGDDFGKGHDEVPIEGDRDTGEGVQAVACAASLLESRDHRLGRIIHTMYN